MNGGRGAVAAGVPRLADVPRAEGAEAALSAPRAGPLRAVAVDG